MMTFLIIWIPSVILAVIASVGVAFAEYKYEHPNASEVSISDLIEVDDEFIPIAIFLILLPIVNVCYTICCGIGILYYKYKDKKFKL